MKKGNYIYRTFTRVFILIITGILYSPALLHSQPAQKWILREKLDANNRKLSQNSVLDLYFDQQTGLLWMATEAGLVRYNGNKVSTFDKSNLPSLRSPRFSHFSKYLDKQTISYSKSFDGYFISQDMPSLPGSAYPTYDGGHPYIVLYNYGPKNRKAIFDEIKLLNTLDVSVYWTDSSSYLIAGAGKVQYVKQGSQAGESGITIYITYVSINNKPYVITTDGVFTITTTPFRLVKMAADPLFSRTDIRYFTPSHASVPLILAGDSLYTVSVINNKMTASLYAVLPYTIHDITSIAVNPTSRIVYCGSSTHGLYVFKEPDFYTYALSQESIEERSKQRPDPYGYNNIYSVITFNQGRYAVTNEEYIFDLQSGQPWEVGTTGATNMHRLFNFPQSQNSFVSSHNITATFDEKSLRPARINGIPGRFIRSPGNEPLLVAGGPQETVWGISTTKFGLIQGDSMRVLSGTSWMPDSLKGLSDKNIQALFAIAGVVNKTRLLFKFNNSLYSIDTVSFQFKKLQSLPDSNYRSLTIDDGDRYCWIATYGSGFYLYDIAEDKMYKGPADEKKFLLYAHTFAPDGMGNLLIPTNSGLFRINRDHLVSLCKKKEGILLYEFYDTKNGLKGIEFNGGCIPSFNRLPGGDVLFPSINGLVRVLTGQLQEHDVYPVYIESVDAGKKTYSYTSQLKFAAADRVQYWHLNFAKWSDVFSGDVFYRLDKNKEWTLVNAPNYIIPLTELSGGNHTLEVKVIFDIAGKKVRTDTYQFYVDRLYFEKTWFWVLLAASLALVIFLTSYWRTYRIKQQNKALEQKVREKTDELEKNNFSLKQTNKTLEETLNELNILIGMIREKSDFQKKMISIIGHDVMVPLQYIAKTAGQLSLHKEKISTALKDETIEEINTTAFSLVQLGRSIIHWIKLQEESFILDRVEFNVLQSLAEIIPLHTKMLAAKNNKLELQIPNDLIFRHDPVALRIIIHNLVMNACKFTSNGSVIVKCTREAPWMIVEVTDTGTGMAPETVASLNSFMAVSSVKGTESEAGWGLGYKVIFDLIKASDGTLLVSSAYGKGTHVQIMLHE